MTVRLQYQYPNASITNYKEMLAAGTAFFGSTLFTNLTNCSISELHIHGPAGIRFFLNHQGYGIYLHGDGNYSFVQQGFESITALAFDEDTLDLATSSNPLSIDVTYQDVTGSVTKKI